MNSYFFSKVSDQLDMKNKTGKLRLVPGQSLLKNSSSSTTTQSRDDLSTSVITGV